MQLTKEDREYIQTWIEDKCCNMRCFCCGQGPFVLLNTTVSIGFDIHTTRFHYHEGIPQIELACNNCGHIVCFHSGIMGFKPTIPDSNITTDSSSEEDK